MGPEAGGECRRSAEEQMSAKQQMTSEDRLDFEFEPLAFQPINSSTKKRKKVIGLDDLLADFQKEKDKHVKRESSKKRYGSDEVEEKARREKEKLLSKFVAECQQKVQEINSEEECHEWGQQIFGQQKSPPPLTCPELGGCKVLQLSTDNELDAILGLDYEKGESFLEGLLLNGWLSKLAFAHGCVEDSIVSWTFNLMVYSSKECLQESACKFWLDIFSSKNKVNMPTVTLEHIPSYADLRNALEIYGYLSESSVCSSLTSKDYTDSDRGSEGPPQNIRSWIKYLAACSQVRSIQSIFSPEEVKDLLCIVIRFFLDRRLQGLSSLLNECVQSLINFFEDDEWTTSSQKLATSLACRMPKDFNCLRVAKCISVVNARTKHLRSELAFQILINFFNKKATEGEEVLKLLISINVKDKNCDFYRVYIYLILAEIWLFSSSLLEQKPEMREMWMLYVRNYSCQIASTDWRSYASKVRNKASYLLQNTIQRSNSRYSCMN